MSAESNDPSLLRGVLGLPSTRLGRWSTGLVVVFFVLFGSWLTYVTVRSIPRPTFFSDPFHAVLILAAAASGISAGVGGVIAVVVRRERSILVFASIAVAAIVAQWTFAHTF